MFLFEPSFIPLDEIFDPLGWEVGFFGNLGKDTLVWVVYGLSFLVVTSVLLWLINMV